MTYYFEDYERLQLWFSNPNVACAFLVPIFLLLFPLFYNFFIQKKWLILSLISVFQSIVLLLIINTYSRGGFVALTISIFLYPVVTKTNKVKIITVLLIIAFTLCVVSITDFNERIALSYIVEDKSSTNRLLLWKYALSMIYHVPQGQGSGLSGEVFVQFFQPLGRNELYLSMVNSYLTILTEQGVFITTILLTILFFPIWNFLSQRNQNKQSFFSTLRVSCFLSLIGFFISNIFSNLWIYPTLWIFPIIAWIFLLFPLKSIKIKSCYTLSFSIVLTLSCIYTFGSMVEIDTDFESHKQGVFVLKSKDYAEQDVKEVLIIPDKSIVGNRYGHYLRRSFQNTKKPIEATIVLENYLENIPQKTFDEVYLFGNSWMNPEVKHLHSSKIFLIVPSAYPEELILDDAVTCEIFLPSLDPIKSNWAWIEFSEKNQYTYHYLRGVHSNIERKLGSLLSRTLETEN